MRFRKIFLLLTLCACLGPGAILAASIKSTLDTNAIHGIYMDGDFDNATTVLETALQGREPLSHGDSTFIFKHLGVMYAANEDTREKGKYYMLQLITLEPTIRILDMYASDMIYQIFKNIKDEFEINQNKVSRAEGHGEINRSNSLKPEKKPSQSSRKYYWMGGTGLAVAGVGLVTFFLLDAKPTTKKSTYVVE